MKNKERYGQLPKVIDVIKCEPTEMMFYQDMPIKLVGETECKVEKRIMPFYEVIATAVNDYIETFGLTDYRKRYVYVSVKNLFQPKGKSYNRDGWHCDGFMSSDVTYIWSDTQPTIFNNGIFNLSQDHSLSIKEMEQQALEENNMSYIDNTLVRMNQYNVHKVGEVVNDGMRAFVKVSFSYDKYDLIGNAKNYELDYNWQMKPRSVNRNVPQSEVTK